MRREMPLKEQELILICQKQISPSGDSLSDTLESYVRTLGNNLLMTAIQYRKKPLFIVLTVNRLLLTG